MTDRLFDAVCLGYNSVDLLARVPRMPRLGEKLPATEFSLQGGGQAATAAVALARFGFRVRYVGKFGGTPYGALARESIASEGVDVSACVAAPAGVENQIASIWIEEQTGERTSVYKRPPELEQRPDELDRGAVCSGRILLVDAHQIPAIARSRRGGRRTRASRSSSTRSGRRTGSRRCWRAAITFSATRSSRVTSRARTTRSARCGRFREPGGWSR